ncbi:MAG: PAS domain S-box protein [Syntrophomonas sp.]
MKNRYDGEDLDQLRNKLIGMGEQSFRKSYYPELQERLQQLERFRTLLDQSNDAIFLLHVDSKTIADVNESACLQLQYSREELLSMGIDSLFQLPDKKYLAEELQTVINKDKPYILNITLPKKNGGKIPAEVTIRMVAFDNTGYAVAVARDVTERRQAQQKLQDQFQELQGTYEELSASYEEIEALTGEVEESYNNLIKNNLELTSIKERLELALWGAQAGMWDWYIQTGALIFNERYAEIHGYKLGELPSKLAAWETRINPEDWPYVEENLYSHINGKTPYFEVEYRIKNKTGEWIWIQDNGRVVSWDKKGKPERAVGTVQEITKRKETELALKESEQRYHEVFENTSDGIFLIDLTSDGRFRYAGCNPEFEKLVGSLSSRLNGRFPEELFPPEISPALNGNYQRCVDIGGLITYTQELKLPVGLKYLHTTLIPVSNTEGNIYRIIGIDKDITERLKAEEAAQMEERRLRSLVHISQIKTGSLQELLNYILEEGIAFSNSRLGYIFFYDEEKQEFTLHAWSQTAMRECMISDPPHVYALDETGIWGEAVRQRKPIIVNGFPSVHPLKKGCPKGHVNLLSFLTIPIFKDGKIIAVIGVANKETDYTELDVRELNLLTDSLWKVVEIKEAEEALIKSEEKFSTAFYSNPLTMALISNIDGRYIEINEAFEKKSGYRRDEVVGRLVTEVGMWPDKKSFMQAYEKFQTAGSVRNLEQEFITKNNDSLIVRVSADILELNGEPCILASIENITDQRKAEKALASSMIMYQEIVNATNNPVLLLDNEKLTVIEANPAAQIIFGYNMTELKGLKFTALSSLESNEASKLLNEYTTDPKRQPGIIRRGIGKKKNGESLPIWIYLNTIVINEESRVLAIITDLSEEVRFQQEQEKAARYEAQAMKMTTMSAMSAGVVHEISQPLNALKVLADGMLYRRELGHHIDIEEAFDTFTKISVQTERINEIIRHMRNLTSFVQSDPTSFSDLNAAITESMQILGQQLVDRGINIELDLDRDISPVWGHEEHLGEIIINLIVNAMHAVKEQQQGDKKIKCLTRQEDDQVILEIADNGPGISEEIGNKIWDPFFSTRKGGEGMGLGLKIVQSIISRQGGSITYYNNNWGGATFKVVFPVRAKDPIKDYEN